MKKTIKIDGKEYTLKHCIRARIIFESITGKMWNLNTITDQTVYFYSMLIAGSGDGVPGYDRFLDCLDEEPGLFVQYTEFMQSAIDAERSLLGDKKTEDSGKN
ncbi:hypothetical protein [Prevotella sp. KH2C16]|uniref:hypothetical protein n=1 Tax=Prevotella sp. KH2C16 TaxID=1855325 RepID=UPI0008E0D22C|nr:hypothetical protein [Prevotella sp. KH2C16]SFF96440.1 hypothetical protein SAMN05216383_1035 [Prevotella sp. KH2C16]